MVIAGSLIYGVHRAFVYPIILRFLVLITTTQPWSWWYLLPWGNTTSQEFWLESRMAKVDARNHSRFVGWASELHLLYIAVEIALVTMWCPGWPIDWPVAQSAVIIGAFGVFVGAWDRQLLQLEINL
jgi:hypothetical protein